MGIINSLNKDAKIEPLSSSSRTVHSPRTQAEPTLEQLGVLEKISLFPGLPKRNVFSPAKQAVSPLDCTLKGMRMFRLICILKATLS